ncbi:MAG TPA: MFS transporter [Methylomirabilota bacterium]|nr:MFS transporter [Methylomirabilota bacterium]
MTLSPGRVRHLPLLQPLRHRDFRLVWMGETASVLGDHFHYVALAWLTLQLTQSGLALGTVLMAAAIPRAALMLLGGAVTDRFTSRDVMLATNVARGVLMTVVAALVLTGRIELWHLYVMAVGFGVAGAFFYPAMSSIAPSLVTEHRLPAANALIEGTRNLGTLLGPAMAGVVVAVLGTGPAFVVDAASFGLASLALLGVSRRARPSRDSIGDGILGAVAAGLRYAWGDPAIRTLVLMSAAINFAFGGSISVGLAWLADMRFAGGPAALGLMLASFGGGAMTGTIAAGSLRRPARQGTVLVAVLGAMGLGLGLIGLVPTAQMAALVLAGMGIGAGYVNVLIFAWLQARAERAMLGRLMSLVMLGAVGLTPLSYAVAGIVIDTWATLLFLAAGSLVVATAAVTAISGTSRRLD